jgi:hypothetical protein
MTIIDSKLSFLEVTDEKFVRCLICPEFWDNMGEAVLHEHGSYAVEFMTEFEGRLIITDGIGLPIKIRDTERGVRCGECKNRHHSAKAVKLCYEVAADFKAEQAALLNAEMAYERHLEDRGWQEAAAQDAYERANGVIGFREAWHNESPETCPCCN